MKKIICLLLLLFTLAVPALGLTHAEYQSLMTNAEFARADKRINKLWDEAQRVAPQSVLDFLKQAQTEWWDSELDSQASNLMDEEKCSREAAYANATELCADKLQMLLKGLSTPMKTNKLIGEYVRIWEKVEGVEWLQDEINETGYLSIKWANKKKSEVKIELETYGGGGKYTPHMGEWSGRGVFKNSVLAISDEDVDNAHIIFVFKDDKTVMVAQTSGMSAYQGMGAFFDGEYVQKKK